MPIPKSGSEWPPQELREPFDKMREWSAWYSGEPTRLIDFYAAQIPAAFNTRSPWYRFWSRSRQLGSDGQAKSLLHVPVASDLAATSAALLFGESPRIRIKEAHEDEEVEEQQTPDAIGASMGGGVPGQGPQPTRMGGQLPFAKQPSAVDREVKPGFPPDQGPNPAEQVDPLKKKKPETPAQKTEARLLELIELGEFYSRLMEAAETCAGIGGVYLYPAWDKRIADHPFVAIAQADSAIPTFRYGYLVDVTFWRLVRKDGDTHWRHFECHYTKGEGEQRKAYVDNALFKGTDTNLGVRVGVNSIQEMEGIEAEVTLPLTELDVQYLPNIRPNRLWRQSGLGVADVQGSEGLLDAVDETYASWMRDIRLAKARIIVPTDYLDYSRDEDGKVNASFDIDQEVFVPMEIAPSLEATATSQMLAHQFAIRWQEHESTINHFVRRVISNAGYSATTMGEKADASNGVTAAGLRVTEHKTIMTQRRKGERWRPALARLLHHLLLIDKEIFDSGVMDILPSVEMSDGIIDQPLELAQTALALKTAESASTETRVKLIHPEWTDAEVASEVERIKGEVEAAKPPVPVMGPGGPPSDGKFGDPNDSSKSTGNFPNNNVDKGPSPSNPPPPSPPLARGPGRR